MIKIRKNIFETNSSSTHSIVCSDVPLNDIDYDVFIPFSIGSFGWEMQVLDDSWSRASYFYTAACELYERDVKDDIIELLAPLGIECIFNEECAPHFEFYQYNGTEGWFYLDNGGIDHCDGCEEFVKALMGDGEKLARFLLSDKSFVVTGNDNCDEIDYDYMDRQVARAYSYPHTIFYKGN